MSSLFGKGINIALIGIGVRKQRTNEGEYIAVGMN